VTGKKDAKLDREAELDRLLGVREHIRGFPGGAEVVFPIEDYWDVHVEVRPQDGNPRVTGLRVAPNPHLDEEPPPLTARTLRKINLGRTFELLRQHAMGAYDDPLGPKGRLTKQGFTGVKPARGSRPGRRGHDDRFYAWIAALYVRAIRSGSQTPVKDVAEADEVRLTIDHVRDLLGVARKKGLLTPARKGVAEGALTDRARELLGQPEGDA
jgi:hypothetical protein